MFCQEKLLIQTWVGLSKDSKHKGKKGTNFSSNNFFRVEIAVTNMYICKTNAVHAVTCCS